MASTPPSPPDVDYIIGLNAHEEARLAELVADFTQTYGALSKSEAMSLLRERLTQLISQGRVRIGECSLPGSNEGPETIRELPIPQAIDTVMDTQRWDWEPIPNHPLLVLIAVDMDMKAIAAAARETAVHGS